VTVDDAGRAAPILVLRKVADILGCFSIDSPEPTLQELTRKTGLPSSTCQRLVQNMVREGFLDREGDRYRIGLGLVRWATPGTVGLDAVRLIKPILQTLRDETGETAIFYVRDGAFRTVVAVAETRHVVIRPFMVGQVMPLHAGAPGKVFLAFDEDARAALKESELVKFTDATPDRLSILDEQISTTRARGFCAAFGERHDGVGSISAPVFDHESRLAGALGLGFPTQRVADQDVARLAPLVVRAAGAASSALGYVSPK
jgi:DNA-binding IclR family transcriptional regulator